MPRGKLHYESEVVDGELIETWLDSHGNRYIQGTLLSDLVSDEEDDYNEEKIDDPEMLQMMFSDD